ncbi:MAG: hypothetical protein ACI9OJ_005926 [Myxococcota bacterium]|jgi:hypothetical protein
MDLLTVLVMAWATQSGDVLLADTINVPDSTLEALEKKHGDKILPVDHPDMPAGLKLPTWTVITTAGAELVGVMGVQFVRGAGENHAFFVLKPTRPLSKGGQVEGLAIAKTLSHSPKLVAVPNKTTDRKLLKIVNKAFQKARGKKLSKKAAKWVPRRLKPEHVSVVSGRFGGDFRYVYVSIPAKPSGKHRIDAGYVSAFGKLDSKGVITWGVTPRLGLSTLTPRYTVDSDGDGKDELIYSDHYYEGSYDSLLHPNGTKVRLGGDGA